MAMIAVMIIASGGLSLLCLLALHFFSPEFKPGWRMVSEYAFGRYKWLLTMFFVLWSISSLLTACLMWNTVAGGWAAFGAVLVFISGIGAFMGGLFDVNHKLHGLSFALGVPTLPVGALLVSSHLASVQGWDTYRTILLLSAHSTWVSVVIMALSMMLVFSGFKKAGITWDKDSKPPEALPAGVTGMNGYANRLLVLCHIGWLICIDVIYLSI